MKKKGLALCVISLCVALLCGCSQVVDLTDEETQLIAEYAADVLLKHDLNYKDRIEAGNEKAQEMATEEMQENTGDETQEQITEEADTEETTMEQSTTESGDEQAPQATEGEDEGTGTAEATDIGTESNIGVIAGLVGVDITYRDYTITDKYPATDEQGEFIFLEASEGYQLLVVRFDVVNTTDGVVSVSLLDKELDYRVVCNGTKAAKPMLTILMDDLGTLETNVESGTAQEAVLVFQISDNMQQELQTMDLYVTYNNTENVIKILQ
ncbi:MAG: hypothetical protein IJP29_07450 [Lachnospiraceae bacterium]|nr:hypothetical protein [Lachnospiraceae bacterium]